MAIFVNVVFVNTFLILVKLILIGLMALSLYHDVYFIVSLILVRGNLESQAGLAGFPK